ncbi:hypothetical protein IPC733_19120 [Pseudomonas aeruginosa]|nr:hypothetical protein [Pseudomonas aeruginosa]MCO2430373.1 hypothetical protein [Pseudomonas aeruginosa]MCO2931159.1 hypothetical protein [Pseudomonas aeruginosa]MCO3866309.1 hypothetical protein [Pseudomonas aeruginosa]MDV6779731.1 hypothetical protein [Pseudomonas aeruginosa]
MRKSRPGVVRFHSGLRVSARNTQSGPVLGTGGELGGSTGTTSPGTDFGAGGEWSGSTGTTSPGTDFGAGGELGALLRVAMGNSPATNHVFPTARSYPDQHDVAEPLPYIGTLHHG